MKGRKPLNKSKLTVYIDQSAMDRLDLMVLDPVRKKIKHGLKSLVVERLIERWLAEGARMEVLGL